MKRGALVNLGVVLAATMVAVYTANVFLAFRPYPTPIEQRHLRRARIARATHVAVDERTKIEVVRDLRLQGIDAWPAIPAGLLRDGVRGDSVALPLGGISGVISVHCNELGQFVIYRADERGLTNPPGTWSRPRADVAVVGDSYVQSFCVPVAQSFPALLRTRFPATVAAGMSNAGPLVELGLLREYAAPLRPRHVVWVYYESNDLQDLERERKVEVLKRYMEPGFSQHLVERQAQVDARLRVFLDSSAAADSAAAVAAERRKSLFGSIKKLVTLWHLRQAIHWMKGPVPSPCCDLPYFSRVIQQAIADTRAWGGDFTFVYMPSFISLTGAKQTQRRPWTLADSVRTVVSALGVPVLDLRDSLRNHGPVDSIFPYMESHMTARGNRIVADILVRHLARIDSANGVISAPAPRD